MAEKTNRDAPSGWWHAPRPRTEPAARRAVSSASIPPDPSTSAPSAGAMPGRPSLHGPHWPDDSAARYRATAAQVDAFRKLDQLRRLQPPQRAEYLLVRVQVDAAEPVESGGEAGLAYP